MRTLIGLIILLTINSTASYSQQNTVAKNIFEGYIFKTDIILPVLAITSGNIGLSSTLERCFKHRHSFQITALIYNYYETTNPFPNFSHVNKEQSSQIISEYRFFINKKEDYTGFYSGIYLKYLEFSSYDNTTGGNPTDGTHLEFKEKYFGGGIIAGYQNYFSKHWAYDALIGAGIRHLLNREIIKETNSSFDFGSDNKFDGRVAFNIGYRF